VSTHWKQRIYIFVPHAIKYEQFLEPALEEFCKHKTVTEPHITFVRLLSTMLGCSPTNNWSHWSTDCNDGKECETLDKEICLPRAVTFCHYTNPSVYASVVTETRGE